MASRALGADSLTLTPPSKEPFTVTIVRVGSNEQYASNWDSIFGGKKGKTSAKAADKKATAKKPAAKAAKKAVKASTKKKTAKKKK